MRHVRTPMIIARSLGVMPEFLVAEFGSRAFDRVMGRSGLPARILQNRDLYIPEAVLTSFLMHAAREAGEDLFGLSLAPHLTVADYGGWGEYVLSAPTLGASLQRVKKTIALHSHDSVSLSSVSPGVMQFKYEFAARNAQGYDHISTCAVGVICSIFRHFAGVGWRPHSVDLDLSHPGASTAFEDVFRCAVHFDKQSVAVRFAATDLSIARPSTAGRAITVGDIRRERFGGAPKSSSETVWFLIMLQLLDGSPDLDQAARSMGVSQRGLQRMLASEGNTFREIVSHAVVQRSKELLSERDLTVTDIAIDLGYSTPSHFARAFRKQTGMSPQQFRSTSGQ